MDKFLKLSISIAVLVLAFGTAAASTVLGLSVEDQARLANLVIVGTIVGQQGIDHADNGLETEVTMVVRETYKGDVKPGETVIFHTRGGELDGVISEAVGEAVFKTGEDVLVFIEEVDGRLYNLGLSMGVWNVLEDKAGRMSFTRAIRDGLLVVGDEQIEYGPIPANRMKQRIAHAMNNPQFDNQLLREQVGTGR